MSSQLKELGSHGTKPTRSLGAWFRSRRGKHVNFLPIVLGAMV